MNMDKLKMHTPNRADDNFKKLAALFPNAVTETINENGEVVRAIDKDVLMQEISCTVVEGNEERYQFTWPDKKKSVLLANAPIAKTLRPCREESVGKDGTPGGFDSENLYIEGDNLEVLKLLQETYLGKIKMIYIDPPYNTGNDFVYEDDFSQSTEDYLANSGQYDDEGNRLVVNTESNGRFHTDWLNMIYPRIRLSKDLLSEDGYLLISIGNAELDNVLKLCDEIFGRTNRAGVCSRQMKTGNNQGKYFTQNTDYIVVYVKNDLAAEPLKDDMSEELIAKVYNKVQESGERKGQKYRTMGLFQSSLKHGGSVYPIECPDGSYCITPNGLPWRWNEHTFLANKAKDEVVFIETNTSPLIDVNTGKKSKWNIYTKIWLNDRIEDGQLPSDMILKFENRHAAKELASLGIPFDFPKPTALIKYLLRLITDKNYFVLDFFSGSATTAHAVMQLNAEDGGNRKFIMVQWPEITYDGKKETYKDKNGEEKERYIIDEKTNYPVIVKDSEARKAGYWTITQIGKERIRRAGQKIQQERLEAIGLSKHEWDQPCYYVEHKEECDRLGYLPDEYFAKKHPPIDTGFRVLKCDTSNMKDVYYAPADYEVDLFDRATDNIKEDRTPEDLLFQVMLDLGVELSSKIEETVIAGKKVFDVADGFLIACFDADVTDETIKTIAQKQPYYFVMRDSSLANDSVATNFEQIFATYSPDTVRKVL